VIEDGRTPGAIAACADLPLRLVIGEHTVAFTTPMKRDDATVQTYDLVCFDTLAEGGGLVVYRDTSLLDPAFDLPARAESDTCKNLL
jgi:hypothetical protein